METIPLSVIVPVYNSAPWLGTCLDSILDQDLENIEIICIDDGSRDRSPEILKEYARKYDGLRVLTHEVNRGLSAARKNGVMEARGEYIMFVDSDDTIDPGLCSCVYDLIRERGTDILEFSARRINTEDNTVSIREPIEPPSDGENVLYSLFSRDYIRFTLWQRIFRADLCRKAFGSIPDFWCYAGDDGLITFFLAYFAGSFSSVKTGCYYNYFFGRGICSDQNMPLDKFGQFCGMNQIPGKISEFLDRVNADEKAYESLSGLIRRMISDCFRMLRIVSNGDKPEAVKIFSDHWGRYPEFAETVLVCSNGALREADREIRSLEKKHRSEIGKLKDRYEAEIDLIYHSKSYRLGNLLISPLHKAAELFHTLPGNNNKPQK